ncbi:hypothetical protein DOTSEDRAFT_21334 [Dothistroma septosporum NZE10]|uniref:C2H2 type master regulator of conidiophore development brlA n=1 Tax=Dothistroma septosporum (strain NZE10 / CBS 128990) TaxID=675120 RepID=N1PVQ6_DOTSN|nr:hypothetical protein DOTSEDRAFT_21334 [Dothistroma septosporum NZE10]
MSCSTTPARPGRGVAVPGIDTRGPAEKALAFSGWPLTPPQSAHDSRRPSLAYSALSDVSHSGPPPISGYSQPATPVHGMAQSQDFTAQWTDGIDLHASMPVNMNDSCRNAHLVQPMSGISLQRQHITDAQPIPTYSSIVQDNFALTTPASPARNAWTPVQQPPSSFTANTVLSSAQDRSPAAGYHNVDQSYHSPFAHPGYPQCESTQALAPSVFQQPQHVVPSQVNAQWDYTMEPDAGYGAVEPMHEGYMQSFDSTSSGFSNFYSVPPASPADAYFDESDPDFVQVKNEYLSSPARGTPMSRSRHLLGAYDPQRISRKGSRCSKRSRKSQHEGKAWFEQEINGTLVRCEGKQFEIKDRVVLTLESKDSKPHRCTFEDEFGKICDRRFERSEHLKRHMGMHSKERGYPCPLPGCNKAFSRPDNTGDHFKTHLKSQPKGRRNPRFTFQVLERKILETYDEKTATKLLNNLRKWIANNPLLLQNEHIHAYG